METFHANKDGGKMGVLLQSPSTLREEGPQLDCVTFTLQFK